MGEIEPQPESKGYRDGTSQGDRNLPALDPGYVSIDERSPADLLEYARDFAKQVAYYNHEHQKDGTWDGFLGDDLENAVRLLERPEDSTGSEFEGSRQPHVALFLTFLRLLEHPRKHLNQFTGRHLDHFYRDILKLAPRSALPDQVHVLIDPAPGEEPFLLPAGTQLKAEPDDEGKERIYRTDEAVPINQARIASLKSLFADQKVIGLREAHEDPSNGSFLAMMSMALGHPNPGDPLPPYPSPDREPDPALFKELDKLLDFVSSELQLPLPAFRTLMELKKTLGQKGADPRWSRINRILKTAATKKGGSFDPKTTPENFDLNLSKALAPDYEGIPDVNSIYELYRRFIRGSSLGGSGESDFESLKQFIAGNFDGGNGPSAGLYMSKRNFVDMMENLFGIYQDWRHLYDILNGAARRRRSSGGKQEEAPHLDLQDHDNRDFPKLVLITLGEVGDFGGLEEIYQKIRELEDYFHMSAESFVFIRKSDGQGPDIEPWNRTRVYQILEEAHREKTIKKWRKEIADRRKTGFEEMVAFALGELTDNNKYRLPDNRKFADLDFSKDADQDYIQGRLYLTKYDFDYLKAASAPGQRTPAGIWENVYRILETAQRHLRDKKIPPAQAKHWKNLHASDDATLAQVRLAEVLEDDTPRWKPFGKVTSVPALLGFAIASPVLALSEGSRTIKVILTFERAQFENIKKELKGAPSPFQFQLSTAAEPFTPSNEKQEFSKVDATLTFTIELDEKAPPIARPPERDRFGSPWPILQILLADLPAEEVLDDTTPAAAYQAFLESLVVKQIALEVSVVNHFTLSIQSEDLVLDSKNPFEPFGPAAQAGTRFYLGSPEILSKKIDSLTFNLQWKGAPDTDFATYYANYSSVPKNPNARITMLRNSEEIDLAGNEALFARTPSGPHTITLKNPLPPPESDLITDEDLRNWNRCFRWEMGSPDFQHDAYPAVASQLAVDLAAAIVNKTDKEIIKPELYKLNPPYTPTLKSLSINYHSSAKLVDEKVESDDISIRLWHIHPFGPAEIPAKPGQLFLPQYNDEGSLYVGLENFVAPQRLSLLFQMAEGSANPTLKRSPVRWHYLSGNQWHTLENGNLVSDGTSGLLNTGIVILDLPAAEASTLLPPELHWIRLSIERNSNSVCDIVAIHTQAAAATFDDRENAATHYESPLPPESIKEPLQALPQVAAIRQPYSSFGGKPAERATSFYGRTSERLKHKNRALTCWDYEQIILDHFPEVYKVKCLPAGSFADPSLAGSIRIVIIPDIRGKLPFDPFEPRAPLDLLVKIESYLRGKAAAAARLAVRNPHYIHLQVRLQASFRPGFNPEHAARTLERELQQFLSPWAYQDSAEIQFGGRINQSLIVNFSEKRNYVDYVAGVSIFVSLDGGRTFRSPGTGIDDLSEMPGVGPDAILVSARQHLIEEIKDETYEQEFFSGIGFMRLEYEFKIAETPAQPINPN